MKIEAYPFSRSFCSLECCHLEINCCLRGVSLAIHCGMLRNVLNEMRKNDHRCRALCSGIYSRVCSALTTLLDIPELTCFCEKYACAPACTGACESVC